MIKNKIDQLHYLQMNKPLDFAIGDTVNVHYRIIEGDKSRIQTYEGVVIAIKNRGAGKSFTVRRISYDVGVERVFPLYAPTVEKIEVIRSGKVRRSKLYFLREKIGKHGRLKDIKRKPIVDKIFEKAKQVQQEKAQKDSQKASSAVENNETSQEG